MNLDSKSLEHYERLNDNKIEMKLFSDMRDRDFREDGSLSPVISFLLLNNKYCSLNLMKQNFERYINA